MQRKICTTLLEWSKKKNKLPLVIRGSRGVGKTYLINDFAKNNYTNVIYFNFEHDKSAQNLFSSNCDTTLQNISDYYSKEIDYEQTLFLFDEFAVCNNVIDFVLNLEDYDYNLNVICTISECNLIDRVYDRRLVTKLIDQSSLLQCVKLYPLDFEEFLTVTSNDWYLEAIKEHYRTFRPLPEIVHNDLLNLFNVYIYLGGMPDIINEYISTNSLFNISERHSILLNSNLMDLQKNLSDGNYIKTMSVYNTITKQLSKKNKKFQYTLIRKGATKKIYEDNINYLCTTGYTVKCPRYDSNDDSFKLYMLDVGLLNSLEKNSNNDEFNISVVQNYVFQTLISNGNSVSFWESDSQSKIDYVINKNNITYAIEVKNSIDTRSKNYSIFKNNYNNSQLIKISAKNFEKSKGVLFVPLYAVFCI